jgi:pimeloyl-ACP methyl ester carboxylesterase
MRFSSAFLFLIVALNPSISKAQPPPSFRPLTAYDMNPLVPYLEHMTQAPNGNFYVLGDEGALAILAVDGRQIGRHIFFNNPGDSTSNTGIAADRDSNIYVSVSADRLGGEYVFDMLILKLDPSGNLLNTVRMPRTGGMFSPETTGVVFDRIRDRLYASELFFDPVLRTFSILVAAYDSELNLLNTRTFVPDVNQGNAAGPLGPDISLDGAGNVYVGVRERPPSPTLDRYGILKYSPDLAARLWVTKVQATTKNSFFYSMVADPSGGAALAVWEEPPNETSSGWSLIRISSEGAAENRIPVELSRSTAPAIAADDAGNIYWAGKTEPELLPAVVKVRLDGSLAWNRPLVVEQPDVVDILLLLVDMDQRLVATGQLADNIDGNPFYVAQTFALDLTVTSELRAIDRDGEPIADGSPATFGDTLILQVTVSHNTHQLATATGVSLRFVLPNGFTPHLTTCAIGLDEQTNLQTLLCDVPDLPPSDQHLTVIRGVIGAVGPARSTVTVQVANEPEGNRRNNSASVSRPVLPRVVPHPAETISDGPARITPQHDWDASLPTIVLTHGLAKTGDWAGAPDTLWIGGGLNLQGAESLLSRALQDPTQFNLVTYAWPGAFHVEDIPDRDEYVAARRYTFDAGVTLAKELLAQLGTDYEKPIHFIGHSLGTAVNAYAAWLFLANAPNVRTARFTALDRPDRVHKIPNRLVGGGYSQADEEFALLFGFHQDFFATVLSNIDPTGTRGLSLTIDNYYANGSSDSVLTSAGVGKPAQSSGIVQVYNLELVDPNDVEGTVLRTNEGADNDHSGVQQWYRWTIGPNDSVAFKMPNSGSFCTGDQFDKPLFFDESLNPCGRGWSHPDGWSTPAFAPCVGAQTDDCLNAPSLILPRLQPVDLVSEQFEDVHGCELRRTPDNIQSVVCTTKSPAFGIADVDIPTDAAYLTFDYVFPNTGPLNYAVVYLDNEPIWTLAGANAVGGGMVSSGPISVRGRTGLRKLTIALYGDAPGATFLLQNIQTVAGNLLPVANAGGDQAVEATSVAGAHVRLLGVLSEDLDGDALTYTWTGPFGQLSGFDNTVQLPIGRHSVTLTVDDGRGGVNWATILVTVRDTTAPSIAMVVDVVAEATSASGTVVTYALPATSDIVDGDGVASCAPASGRVFALGVNTVVCSALDLAGNSSTADFTVTVRDTTPPALTVPGNLIVEATGPTGATAAFLASALDLVDGSRPVLCSPASGALFDFGTTTIDCSASDTRVNTATRSFNVTVRDTIAPQITVPADQTVQQTSPAGAIVNYPAPSVIEMGSGLASAGCLPASGSVFPVGDTTVTCTASDVTGNMSTATFTVTVTSTSPPTTSDGRMFGAGYVNGGGTHHHFVLRISQVGTRSNGRLEYWVNDPRRCGEEDDDEGRDKDRHGDADRDYGRDRCRPTSRFEATSIAAVAFSDNPAWQPARRDNDRPPTVDTVTFTGDGKWNGKKGYTFEAMATDQGEPGRNRDTFWLVVRDSRGAVVASGGGVLGGGQIQSTRIEETRASGRSSGDR